MKPISYSKASLKTLSKMPKNTAQRIMRKIEAYATDPGSQANNVKVLKGYDGVVRLRVGDWRVLIEDGAVVAVIRIGSRGDVYKGEPL